MKDMRTRSRYIDDYLHECLQSGISQIVILGAGLDSRAYRKETIDAGARVFEVDHPASQAYKIKRVKDVVGRTPRGVVYVPIDFNQETLDKLFDFGLDPSLRSLYIWEGVTYYLTPEAVDAILAWIRANAAPKSTLIFDHMYKSALTGGNQRREMKRARRYRLLTGEGLIYAIERGHIGALLESRGFESIVDADSEKLRKLYCTGVNLGRAVADTYAIVHAEVGLRS
jgi:methyltransferase (TIGR00027 family)